ncbi:MAG: RNA polymerase sigma factor [Bacteroidales bacterium]|jgi:RNA polymerase sigma-70 factor (ECF subfamily)|nr:RNA polymerase sigma factor [Bacteroidales bacterium]
MTTIEFSNQLVELEDLLTRFALKLTANKDDAKDLLQDTFLRALTYHKQFEDSTNLKAWTYTIMKNTFINNYRRSVRHNTTFDTTKDLFFLSQNKDTFNVDPDSVFSEKEINKAIDRLDCEFKVPFRMHTQGYKYKEISNVLGLKIGTVKSRIFFTRKKLAESLEGYN